MVMKSSSQMTATIDDKTKISLFAVVVCIPFLVGGILWLSSVDSKASAAAEDLKTTKALMQMQFERLQSIDNRLSRIEGSLNR